MNTKYFRGLKVAVLAFSLLAVNQFTLAGGTRPQTREVIVGVSEVFIPRGFDSEVDAFVIVSGMFPNGCYSWSGAEVTNIDALTQEIRAKAMVRQGMCTMALVPFSHEVRLGRLQPGSHTLRFINSDGTYFERTLSVE